MLIFYYTIRINKRGHNRNVQIGIKDGNSGSSFISGDGARRKRMELMMKPREKIKESETPLVHWKQMKEKKWSGRKQKAGMK